MAKMFDKKDKDCMDPMEKEARTSAIKGMRKMAEDELKTRMGGVKKVTVAADSEKGLEEGLEKAQELMESAPELAHHDEESENSEDGQEVASSDLESMTEDEIDARLKELMALKARKESKSV